VSFPFDSTIIEVQDGHVEGIVPECPGIGSADQDLRG
jgi:hypothetical protein